MTEQALTVSVVIPAYNEAPRIGRAIQSVVKQTQSVDEIIVVDDGSTDGTSDVVASCGGVVTCVRQANHGLAAARNTGIRHAKNEWIAFLDADDEWLPDHIENAWERIRDHPGIVWYCAAFDCRSEEGMLLHCNRLDDSLVHDGIVENYFRTEARWGFSRPSSMLVRKSVFDEVGSFNVEINHHGEDLDMWFRIALRYPRIAYSNSPGCIYWRRKGSITSVSSVDLPRFLRRIEITHASTKESRGGSTSESDYLIRYWVVNAVKCAIRQNDKRTLAVIARKYDRLLPRQWQAATWLFQNDVAIRFANVGLAVRHRLKHGRFGSGVR